MEELFNLVKNYGYIVRTNNLDGLTSWNEMKTLLSKICECLTWSINIINLNEEPISSIKDSYNYVHDTLGMRGEEDEKECNLNWEKFHFFLQLVRIPKNNECNLVRLAQIAYNLGQLSAVYDDDSVYTSTVKRFYTINNLGVMSTYTKSKCDISAEDLDKIINLIESKIVGSGYLHKYLKYKKKYLQLKK